MGADSDARRARVLRHPDLARRLTEPPLDYRRAEDWSGWIPPAHLEEQACSACHTDPGKRGCKRTGHQARANDSKRRAALAAIDHEAQRRDTAALNRVGGTDGV
jgi:hypothetical protein